MTTIADMAPMQVTPDGGSATTLAVSDIQIGRGLLTRAIRHSGGRFPQTVFHPGGNASINVTMPASTALSVFGVGLTKLTDIKIFLGLFSDGVLQSGANHSAIQAATGGFAVIDSINASHRELAQASVRIIPLAADDLADPWTLLASQTLPTLAAQPELTTLGSFAIGASAKTGLQSASVSFNHILAGIESDSRRYPREVRYGGSSPMISGTTIGVVDIQTALGFEGSLETDISLYLRHNDTTNGTLKTTGVKLACNDAYVQIDSDAFTQDSTNSVSFTAMCKETDNATTPIIYSASATVP